MLIEPCFKVRINKHIIVIAFHLNGIQYNFVVPSLFFISCLLVDDGYLVMSLFSSIFFFVLLATSLIRFILYNFLFIQYGLFCQGCGK